MRRASVSDQFTATSALSISMFAGLTQIGAPIGRGSPAAFRGCTAYRPSSETKETIIPGVPLSSGLAASPTKRTPRYALLCRQHAFEVASTKALELGLDEREPLASSTAVSWQGA